MTVSLMSPADGCIVTYAMIGRSRRPVIQTPGRTGTPVDRFSIRFRCLIWAHPFHPKFAAPAASPYGISRRSSYAVHQCGTSRLPKQSASRTGTDTTGPM